MRRDKQTEFTLCMTGVYPKRTHGLGVYKGSRKVWSVRVDSKLLKQAKPLLKAKFGSECRGVELWLAGLVATQKGSELNGVYPSNTIEIGKLVIERNLRSRRKLVVEEEREVSESVATVYCGFCGLPAIGVFENVKTGKRKTACRFHGEVLIEHEKWRVCS